MTDAKYTEKDMIEFAIEVMRSMPDYLSSSAKPADILEKFITSKEPKKEWEIVAYLHECGGKNYLYEKQEDGQFARKEYAESFRFPESDFMKDGDTIHSVRRFSDGQTFTVDEFADTPRDGKQRITKFEIFDGQMVAIFPDGRLLLKHLTKLPAPLFTTQDGVEIFEDGNYWHVNEDWTLSNFGVSKEWIDYSKPGNDFSTRSAAENYIVNNKPLLSVEDVKEVCGNDYQVHSEWLLEKLTNIVKQKLNP